MVITLILTAIGGFGLGWWGKKLRVRREIWLEDVLRRDGFAEERLAQLEMENTTLRMRLRRGGVQYTAAAEVLP